MCPWVCVAEQSYTHRRLSIMSSARWPTDSVPTDAIMGVQIDSRHLCLLPALCGPLAGPWQMPTHLTQLTWSLSARPLTWILCAGLCKQAGLRQPEGGVGLPRLGCRRALQLSGQHHHLRRGAGRCHPAHRHQPPHRSACLQRQASAASGRLSNLKRTSGSLCMPYQGFAQ